MSRLGDWIGLAASAANVAFQATLKDSSVEDADLVGCDLGVGGSHAVQPIFENVGNLLDLVPDASVLTVSQKNANQATRREATSKNTVKSRIEYYGNVIEVGFGRKTRASPGAAAAYANETSVEACNASQEDQDAKLFHGIAGRWTWW